MFYSTLLYSTSWAVCAVKLTSLYLPRLQTKPRASTSFLWPGCHNILIHESLLLNFFSISFLTPPPPPYFFIHFPFLLLHFSHADITVCSLCASSVDHIATYLFLHQSKVTHCFMRLLMRLHDAFHHIMFRCYHLLHTLPFFLPSVLPFFLLFILLSLLTFLLSFFLSIFLSFFLSSFLPSFLSCSAVE